MGLFTKEMSAEEKAAEELRLAKMGYKQEFKRSLGLIHNFGVSFSHISIIIGLSTLIGYTLVAGGPAGAVYGWIIISLTAMCEAMSMAEICSAYPTSGGLYYWCSKLGGEKWGPVSAWFTAWFNLCGQIGGLTSGAFAISQFIWATAMVFNPDLVVSAETLDGRIKLWGLVEVLLLLNGVLNSISEELMALITEFSVGIHLIGTAVIFVYLLAAAPIRQPGAFVFTHFIDDTGWNNMGFAILLGFLMPAWTYLGHDASAHLSEETQNSHSDAAKGIIYSVGISAIAGFILLLGMLFSIQDIDSILFTKYPQPIVQLVYDATGKTGTGILMAIIITASFCCVFAATISSSRMLFSFARDGGLPKFFYYTDPRSKLPLRTVWLSCGVAMVLAFAGIGSTVALLAFASVGTIALKTANVIPVFIRLTVGKDAFKPNEFHYGKWSIVIGWIAVFEVAFLFVMLCMPQFYPVTSLNLNYTPIMIVAVIAYASLSWIFSARKWFKGPIQHVSDEELEAMEIDAKTAVGGAIRSPEGGSVIAVDSEATSVAVTEQTV